jgi:pimeloyl-ACP methyl ester carboxylesterase
VKKWLIGLCLLLMVGCKTPPSTPSIKQPPETFRIEEKMMDIDGQTIYFKKIGDDKPPLLMLHGYGGSSDGFKKIYPALAKRFTIISVDILGFGRSSKPIDFRYSFPAQANIYYKLMFKLGYVKFSTLGHSMGGEIVMNLSYLYPEAVTHLILSDAPGVETLTTGKGSKKPNLSTELTTVSDMKAYDLNQVRNNRNDNAHHIELHKQRSRRLQIPAKELTVPTLIVWGRKDSSVPWQDGETYDRLLPNSELRIIEEGFHAPFRQKPDEFIAYIDEFFAMYPNTK